MGRISEIETPEEHYRREIAMCLCDISVCEFDLQQSQRCLDRCGDDGTSHWEICVAIHEEELKKNKKYLERLTMGLEKINIKEGVSGRNICEYRN